jgi:hypothetical protein
VKVAMNLCALDGGAGRIVIRVDTDGMFGVRLIRVLLLCVTKKKMKKVFLLHEEK